MTWAYERQRHAALTFLKINSRHGDPPSRAPQKDYLGRGESVKIPQWSLSGINQSGRSVLVKGRRERPGGQSKGVRGWGGRLWEVSIKGKVWEAAYYI